MGIHFNNASELKFNSIKVSFQNLDEWLNISGFKAQFDNKHNKQKLEFELPAPIVFDLGENLKGKFEFNSRYKSRPQKVCLEQNAYFVVESTNKELQFNDLLAKIWPFHNFLILASHSSCHTREIKLKNESQKEIEVFFERLNSQEKSNLKGTFGYLFSYNDIKVDFETIIQKWYSMIELAHPFINPLFDFLHIRKFDENVFLDIIQAIEAFHRRFRLNEMVPEMEHEARIKEILDEVNEKHREWLNERLSFSNEPTLHMRLSEMINEFSVKTVQKMIPNVDKLIKDSKNSRNYYTHFDKTLAKKALKGGELLFLTIKLSVILTCAILCEVGFGLDQIEDIFNQF